MYIRNERGREMTFEKKIISTILPPSATSPAVEKRGGEGGVNMRYDMRGNRG